MLTYALVYAAFVNMTRIVELPALTKHSVNAAGAVFVFAVVPKSGMLLLKSSEAFFYDSKIENC